MSKYDSSAIRNLAFVGHGNTGKTLFCEALLHEAGLVTRLPAGVMDYAQDEKERGYSIDLSIAKFAWQDKQITVLDVPGYQEFFHNAVSALSVVETAVFVIAASDGITVNTRRAWQLAEERKMPRVIVLTKLDGENIDMENLVDSIQKQFGKHCVPFTVPNATGSALSKVHNVLLDNADVAAAYRDKLAEAIVETDDELLNKYLEGETIPNETLLQQMRKGISSGQVIPMLSVVPPKKIGVPEFLQVVADYLPSPLSMPPKKGKVPGKEEEISYEASPEAPFSAQVFKIFNDPFGRMVYFRVYSGTMKSATPVYDVNTGSTERVGNLLSIQGKDQKPMEMAIPGEIIAIGKVEQLQVGHTLTANEKTAIVYPVVRYPKPMVSLAVQPKSRNDEQKITAALAKLAEEDATFGVKRDEETSELVVSGMSNLHLEIMLNRLTTRFKVECTHTLPRIPYRETIIGKADKRFRHKKQTGGHGQFAEVAIKMEPTGRGEGFDFVDKIVGGVIPSQFVSSCEKGINGVMTKGIIAGYPVVDVRVMVYDGKTHEVDSSDAAFQIAASQAFQEAFRDSKPVLLEPIMNLEITIPSKFMGAITGDLNGRRGRIAGSDMNGDYQTIKAQVPLSEVMTYSTDLKSVTGGEGSFTMEFSHYDTMPSHIQEKVIAKSKESKS